MSGLELAALGALSLAYIDSKYRILHDLRLARDVIRAGFDVGIYSYYKQHNGFYVLEHQAKTQPDKLFVVYPEPQKDKEVTFNSQGQPQNLDDMFVVKRYTYKEVYELVLKYSRVLYEDHGVRSRDVIAFDFINKDEFIFLWLALWNIGAVPAFINYNLQNKSLIHCVAAAHSKLFLIDEEIQDRGEAIKDGLDELKVPMVVVEGSFRERVFKAEPLRVSDEERGIVEKHDPACYIYTSGTTGLPKAANMSWKKSMFSSIYAASTHLRHNDVLYSAMPLYHSTAAVLGFLATMRWGATYAVGHKFSTTTFWTQAKLTDATVIQYVGETCRYLLSAPAMPDERNHKVRQAEGNGLRPDVWAKFKQRFNIATISEFYGGTEFPTLTNNHQEGEFAIGACAGYGPMINGILRGRKWDIIAIDPDTQDIARDPNTGLGRRTGTNEAGEFVFWLPKNDIKSEFQGYHNNQEATNEKLSFDVLKKGDAALRTGDLLRMNEDGLIFFVDRLGDTFRWKSENVSTNEVEEAITEVENVHQAVVVGVRVPKHEGRAGFAVIQTEKPGVLPDLGELARHLLFHLPRYAVPIFVKFVDEIERTGNNKIQKKLYRDQTLPPTDNSIYWLNNERYVQLTVGHWDDFEAGNHRL